MATKQKRRDGWIDWRGSKSKVLIVHDLREKKIPVDEKLMSAKTAWESRYKFATQREFSRVVIMIMRNTRLNGIVADIYLCVCVYMNHIARGGLD